MNQVYPLVASFACFIVVIACFMRVNHLPRCGNTTEKSIIGLLAVGALSIAITPFFNPYWEVGAFEAIYYAGTAAFAAKLTWGYWHEIPGMDRRPQPKMAAAQWRNRDRRA